jgi:hypothetical protein
MDMGTGLCDGSEGLVVDEFGIGDPCQTVELVAEVTAGTYWFIVAPSDYYWDVSCDGLSEFKPGYIATMSFASAVIR